MQTFDAASSGNPAAPAIAGVGDRILAFIIDGFILGCYCPTIVWLLLDSDLDDLWWAWFIFLLGPLLFYNLIFEIILKGQSPGKRAAGIRVVTMENESASIGQYVIRWFFSIIGFYFISGVIAMIVISANGKGQSVGDIVAGTKVIKLTESFSKHNAYRPIFPMVIKLEDYDIELARRALYANRELENPQPLTLVSERFKEILNIQTDLPNHQFLATVVKDYNHLSAK